MSLFANEKIPMRLGQFSFLIKNDDIPEIPLPSVWSHYQTDDVIPDHAEIHLKMQELPSYSTKGPAWIADTNERARRVTFVDRAVSRFAVEVDESNSTAIVYVQKAIDRYVLLGIQHAIMLLLIRKCIGLHGVTLLCKDQVVILSAPSGTGKTTLAKLLEEYEGGIVLNGDFTLLYTGEENRIVFEPTPFCGTSKRCLNHRLYVDQIVFLEQSLTNQWRSLDIRQALTQLMNNVFVPEWDWELRSLIQAQVLKLIETVRISAFAFAPEAEAAGLFVKYLTKNKED